MCSLLTAYSMTGFSASSDIADPAPAAVASKSGPFVEIASLQGVSDQFAAAPGRPLNSSEMTLLRQYAANSLAQPYKQLTSDQRNVLCRVIYFNMSSFDKDVLNKFGNDQKLLAGLNTLQITRFNVLILDIRNGKPLNQDQADLVQKILPVISASPAAFGMDLVPLTQYAYLNPKLFKLDDLTALRSASMGAAGISLSDSSVLKEIAARQDTRLKMDDLRVVQIFAVSSGFGSLEAFDPSVIAHLSLCINDNTSMLPNGLVRNFNNNFQKNQAVQFYIVKSNFNARVMQNPNRPRDSNYEVDRNRDMSNRPNAESRGGMQDGGVRQLQRPNQ